MTTLLDDTALIQHMRAGSTLTADQVFDQDEINLFKARMAEWANYELFVLDDEIVRNVVVDEVNATLQTMRQFNLDRPPYDKFSIQMGNWAYNSRFPQGPDRPHPIEWYTNNVEHVRVLVERTETRYNFGMAGLHNGEWSPLLVTDEVAGTVVAPVEESWFMLGVLLVSLLAKNTVKQSIKTGGNVSRRHPCHGRSYYTVIKAPSQKTINPYAVPGIGTAPCAHLRRGHPRWQLYQKPFPNHTRIFIEPTWVNADKNFLASNRVAYKVEPF